MNKSIFLYFLTVIFLIMFIIFAHKGYDKMNNYRNTDYSSENAYVGGDAYNYIINGTHATGYYVLAGTFLIAAVISLVGGFIISDNNISDNNDCNTYLGTVDQADDNDLPPL